MTTLYELKGSKVKKGGIGGAKTVTGLHFESRVNLLTKIAEVPGYKVTGNKIHYQGKLLAYSYPKHDLYIKFLAPKGIDYKAYVSKKYLPDEALYVPSQNTFYIIEVKFQNGGGSVDEKLQTCDFKKKIYLKLLSTLKINVEYMFILNDYFNKSSFDDAFRYIKEVGCDYFFNELPLAKLLFPMPVVSEGDYDPADVEATA